jgi:hypothetical protein
MSKGVVSNANNTILEVRCFNQRSHVATCYTVEVPNLNSLQGLNIFPYSMWSKPDASVVQWSDLLTKDPEVRVRFPALPDFLRSSGSGT